MRAAILVLGLSCWPLGCLSQPDPRALDTEKGEPSDSKASPDDPQAAFDPAYARETFVTTTDLMRYVIAPTCAAQNNECHHNEDFPDMSTEGNLWNLVGQACNLGLGERSEVEDFCEAEADELVVGTWSSRIGSIATVIDDDGAFVEYRIVVEDALGSAVDGEAFAIQRDGTPRPELGSGQATKGEAGKQVLVVTEPDQIADPSLIRQGDENGNGHFGDGSGALVTPGDAHQSYLVRRVFGEETNRVRMPLNDNADNPTEVNRPLDRDAAYALMSWINCMEPTDGPYSPIRYDCPANADNEGSW